MAVIYQKAAADKTLILAPREYVLRPFDLGANWTEIRLGMFWTAVRSTDDNNKPAANETVNLNTPADWPAFGIKDSATTALPGQAGARFLGLVGWKTGDIACKLTDLGGTWRMSGDPDGYQLSGYDGVTLKGVTTNAQTNAWVAADAQNAAGYNGFFGLKMVVANRGLVTQNVTLTAAAVATVAGADYSIDVLRTQINNGVYANLAGGNTPWNDGVAALPLPDAWFLRLPWFLNRIRVSAMQMVRYA